MNYQLSLLNQTRVVLRYENFTSEFERFSCSSSQRLVDGMWNAKSIYVFLIFWLLALFQGNVLVALPTVRFHIVSSSIQMRCLWTFQCLLNEVVIGTIIVSGISEKGTPFRIEKKKKRETRTQRESGKSVISRTVDVWFSVDASLRDAKSLPFFRRALSRAFSNKSKIRVPFSKFASGLLCCSRMTIFQYLI